MAFQPSADSFGVRRLGFKRSWLYPRQANDVSPLFWSGDQHPQESALVIMVRVGDCGPGAWGTSFGVP